MQNHDRKFSESMVDVAQLVEPRVVIPVVVGSNPIVHPILLYQSYTNSLHKVILVFNNYRVFAGVNRFKN